MKWPAAYPLIDYLNKSFLNSLNTKEMSCIELGSGTGILGLYLGLCWEFKKLLLSDFDAKVISKNH